MSMIHGVTITLYERQSEGTDAFNRPIYTDVPVEVENVLIQPTASSEILDTLNLTGKKAVYTLAIPKGDTHNWEDARVSFFGEDWRVISIPAKGIESMIPLDWNLKIQVERYEQ